MKSLVMASIILAESFGLSTPDLKLILNILSKPEGKCS